MLISFCVLGMRPEQNDREGAYIAVFFLSLTINCTRKLNNLRVCLKFSEICKLQIDQTDVITPQMVRDELKRLSRSLLQSCSWAEQV